jgi:hypothetical protein
MRSRSSWSIAPWASIDVRRKASSGAQYSVPISTSGKSSILRVWINVAASNSSSIVPKPPGSTTKA